MRLQSSANSCGPSTVANVMRAFGYTGITEEFVAKKAAQLSAVNEENPALGTVEAQIKRCLSAIKVPHFEFTCHNPGTALAALRGYVVSGDAVLLAVDDDGHWLSCLAVSGERYSIVDSADAELNVFYGPEDLASRWGTNSDPPVFYGIVCRPKAKKRK